MTYIKINETLYPATVSGKVADKDWDNRESKSITLEMDYGTAIALFVNGLVWSIIQRDTVPTYEVDENGEFVLDENGKRIPVGTETKETEFDNSDYNLAGDITDHRDGTITVKMGKLTELEEAYELMLGDVENEPIPEGEEIPEPIPEDTEIIEGEDNENTIDGDITEGGIE